MMRERQDPFNVPLGQTERSLTRRRYPRLGYARIVRAMSRLGTTAQDAAASFGAFARAYRNRRRRR